MVEIYFKPSAREPVVYVLKGVSQSKTEKSVYQFNMHSHIWHPPTDMFETEQAIIIRLEIAGMDEADISLVIEGQNLVVKGVRTEPPEKRAYHQMEIRFGEFLSEVNLPYPVDTEKIEAVYSNGFLKINLPRIQAKKVTITENPS
jgi:HSP20 family protein